MEKLEELEWYVGDFALDCALGNNYEKSIGNIIKIPYTIKDDLCYFYNIETNEYIKLPIKYGDKYPFSTGLDKNSERIIDREYAFYLQKCIRIDLKKEIEIINDIRNNKQDEWRKLKIIHDSWIPYSLSDKDYIPTKSEKEYNQFIYRKKYNDETSNREYIWKLVPFVINQEDANSKYGFKTIMIPIAFSYKGYANFTYLKKWKKSYLPTQKDNSRPSVYYREIISYPDVLGLTNDMEESKDISNEEVIEWFSNTDLEKITKLVENVEEIKRLNANYEESKIIYPIKELFINNDSIIDIINQINIILKENQLATITIENYIKKELKNNNKLELNDKQIKLLSIISTRDLIDKVKNIKILDDNIAIIQYNDYYPDFITKIEGFYNTNSYNFIKINYEEQQQLSRYYTNESYDKYNKLLEKMLNTLLKKLKIDNDVYIKELSNNIFIPYASFYLNKKLLDLYKAKREEEDISIDFIYIEPREYEEPIIKKGTITQYGKTDDFLIEERNIEILNIQKEEKNKVKIKN